MLSRTDETALFVMRYRHVICELMKFSCEASRLSQFNCNAQAGTFLRWYDVGACAGKMCGA